jgi:predicted AlkP superfamily phosphohydrolase/phosphomutase
VTKKIIILISVLVILFAAVFLVQKLRTKIPDPVVILGLDGADWNIINPLIKKGKLPNLDQLIKEGSSGVLETIRPTKSPVIWTSIATGKTMLKHGVLDWVYIKENNIQIPYSGDDIRVKPFWKILSEKKFKTGVINWFCTFPAGVVNGYLISDRFRVSIDRYLEEDSVTYPPEIKDLVYPKVVKIKNKKYLKIMHEEGIEDYWLQSKNLDLKNSEYWDKKTKFFRRYFVQDKSIENIALFLLENIQVDIFAVYFRLIDATSHFASIFLDEDLKKRWRKENRKYGEPLPETEKLLHQNMASIMEPVYTYMDNIVGRIANKVGKKATFILISDHGFNFSSHGYSHYRTKKLAHGIIIVKGPDIKEGHKLKNPHIYDISPTLLHFFSMPVAEDMDGKVLLDAFKRRRKVRKIPTYETGKEIKKEKKRKALDKEMLEDLKSLGYIR